MIKKLVLTAALLCVGVPSTVFAWDVWRSSYTATIDTTRNLCGGDAGIVTNRRGIFHGVCVSSAAVNGTFSIYNSSGTTINPIAILDLNTNGCFYYDVVASTVNKGLTYSNTGLSKLTILYDCY